MSADAHAVWCTVWGGSSICSCRATANDPPETFNNVRCELCNGWHAPPACEPRATYHFSLTDAEREVLAAVLAEVARKGPDDRGDAEMGEYAAMIRHAASIIREAIRLKAGGAT